MASKMHLATRHPVLSMRIPRTTYLLVTLALLFSFSVGGCRRSLPEGTVAWRQSLSELDACTRRKHIESARCDICARRALEEKHPEAARLFRALARSERIHERNCLKAIRRLGGRYTPPPPITIPVGTTEENIRTAILSRHEELNTAHRSIERTFEENNRYAGRLLIHITGGESHQLMLLERYAQFSQLPQAQQPHGSYVVCPKCGNIYKLEYCDPYCPFCLTDSRDFILIN